jgi:DNA helicase INO80
MAEDPNSSNGGPSTYALRSPTQTSFPPPPYSPTRSQHSNKPATPAPRAFNPPSSPQTLPPIASALASAYYDPTQDTGRQYQHQHTYGAPEQSSFDKAHHSPIAAHFPHPSPQAPPPPHAYSPARPDNMSQSPISPKVYHPYAPPQPSFERRPSQDVQVSKLLPPSSSPITNVQTENSKSCGPHVVVQHNV